MVIDFKNKNVLIGGSTSGIGFEIARKFSASGANVFIIGRDKNKLINTLDQLNNQVKREYILADFSDVFSLEKKMKELAGKYEIDVIINNVGGPMPKLIENISKEEMLNQFHKQFLSFFIITNTFLPKMKQKKYGRIINIIGTSVQSIIDKLGLSTPKSCILYWAKTLSEEIGKYGITVNNIMPGPTETPELERLIKYYANEQNIYPGEFQKKLIEETSVKRLGKPEDIAYMALYLASDYASFITGTSINVDGGFSKCLK